MKITNKFDLPESFVKMAQSDYSYKDKRYSVTTIIQPIRQIILRRRHDAEIEEDVSNMIWLLFGTAAHSILEHAGTADDELSENKLEVKIGDYTLSGIFDLYSAGQKKVTDYKTCSVYKVLKHDYTDWEHQLKIYCYMLNEIGFECNSGEIVAIMKDWTPGKAKFDPEYPKYAVQTVKFRFTKKDMEDIEKWLKLRFDEISKAEKLKDENLPMCSLEERFNTGDKYAVMKKGRKRAVKVFDDKDLATQYMKDVGADYIEERHGEDKRCADYCSVNGFCSYWREKNEKDANLVCKEVP